MTEPLRESNEQGRMDEGLEIPESDFTFFPDSDEQQALLNADPSEIAELFHRQPDMSARFAHELRRTGDLLKLYTAFQTLPVEFRVEMVYEYLDDMVTSGAMMRSMFGENINGIRGYVSDCVSVYYKAVKGISLDEQMGDVASNTVSGMTDFMIDSITSMSDEAKQRINDLPKNS